MSSVATLPLILALLLLPQEAEKPLEEEWNEQTCQEVKIWDLDQGEVEVGELKVYVDAKYGGRTRSVNTLNASVRFVPKGDLSETIRSLRHGDNLRFYGIFQGPPDKPGGSFDFYRVERMKVDDHQFADKKKDLNPGDIEERLRIGDWAMDRFKFYGPDAESLENKALGIYEEALTILEEEGSPDDFDHQFRIARILQERMGFRDRALAKLKETCLRLRPDDPVLLKYLKEEIGAILYRDNWVPYEKFKAGEGFKQREDGTWVRDPIDRLERFVEEKLPEPPKVLDNQAEAGDVVKGMTPAQVIRGRFVARKGSSAYPEYVLRAPLPRRGTAEIWVYPDAYLFFRTSADPKIEMKLWTKPVLRK